MKKSRILAWLVVISAALSACSSTKPLADNQYMLVRNNVEVIDAKSPDFDDLNSYVRPVTNKKFMEVFSLKTMLYSAGQPTISKKTGEVRDSKFKQWLRNRVGEAPVLLDSAQINSSISQLDIMMNQLGYFDSEFDFQVIPRASNHKKVKVNYLVKANQPYFVSRISYNIDIPEYKKIVILNQKESLLSVGMRYQESLITDELTRIINLIRDEGYYYVEKSIIRCEVSYDQPTDSLQDDPKTVSLEITMRIPENEVAARYLYKYYFDNVYIQTNFNSLNSTDIPYDTVVYSSKQKWDSTAYHFVTPHDDYSEDPIVDYHYKTIADALFSQKGVPYSQQARRKSSQALTQLDNFDYMSMFYKENESKLDTLHKVGYLDAYYVLSRKKVHSVGGQIDLRNDKSAISFSYTNRNIFKGAEKLTINLSGGYFYYSLENLFGKDRNFAYPEFGISASLHFPKLFLFNNHQKRDAVKYSTSVGFGVNYSGLYRRLMYNLFFTYYWSPNYYTNHSISPIDISTINNNDKRYSNILNYNDYAESYQDKFGKFMLMSLKYNFNFLVPFSSEKRNHNMRLSINAESSGLLLKGLNALFTKDHRWVFNRNALDSTGYNYTTYEKLEFTWNYTYKINRNNAIAMRMNAGAIIPLDKDSYVPYERGFYLGTSNSMRGWGYRGLGPGSYEHGKDSLFTGDIKFEFNLEYRGTIYRSFKYALFSDIGNIWLSRKYDDMPNAEFAFNRFYKELAVDLGVGIRLDFDFFVIRVDYAVPIYDPTRMSRGSVINSRWLSGSHRFNWFDGLKIAIGYAF